MRAILFSIVTSAVFLNAEVYAEPLEVTGHWAIYLPESDEVEFRARFNKEPEFPPNWLHFEFATVDGDFSQPIVRVGGASLRERAEVDVIYDTRLGGLRELVGTFPHELSSTFALLGG